jgi:putative ABC transport system permease protein
MMVVLTMKSSAIFSFNRQGVWRQAWKALTLHRLRSLLSTMGIVFAVVAVVTMLAIAEGAKKESLEQIGRLGTNNIIIRNSQTDNGYDAGNFGNLAEGLRFKDVLAIRQIPGIEDIAMIRESSVFLSELGESDVIGTLAVNHSYLDIRGLILAKGRFISDIDAENRHQVCVLGGDLGKRIGPGSELGSIIHFDNVPHRVVGILQSRSKVQQETLPISMRDFDNTAFTPLEKTKTAYITPGLDEALSEIIIKISDTDMIGPVSMAIRRALLWQRDGMENFELVVPKELLSQARQAQRLFNIVLGSIAGISLLVGGIGIMNIMLANVSERTTEIGIRRAVGANTNHIIAQFLGESILLTVIGGGVGIVFGSIAALSVNVFIQWETSTSLWAICLAMVMAIGVGIVSGIYPAVKAAKMDPVEALRHN